MMTVRKDQEPLIIQLSTTTAEDQRAYFTGDVDVAVGAAWARRALPDGQYRVVAGGLYRIVQGTPPALQQVDAEQ